MMRHIHPTIRSVHNWAHFFPAAFSSPTGASPALLLLLSLSSSSLLVGFAFDAPFAFAFPFAFALPFDDDFDLMEAMAASSFALRSAICFSFASDFLRSAFSAF